MSRFLNMLPVRTRAVIPDYSSQWRDYLQTFSNVPDELDYLEAGYPYSIYDGQITFSDDGDLVPFNALITEDELTYIATEDGLYMEAE